MPTRVEAHDGSVNAISSQNVTSLSSSAGLTVPAGAKYALLQAFTQNVRWRDDGTAPTASIGFQILAGDPPVMYSGNLEAIRFIEEAASASLFVTYYKQISPANASSPSVG